MQRRLKTIYLYLCIVLAVITALVIPFSSRVLASDATVVTIKGRQILLNGQPFLFKGMNYAPTPIGETPNNPPNGDYFTANYQALWQRDLTKMREMGVNVIRVFGWNPDRDHAAFLNAAWNNENKPIYLLVTSFIESGTVINKKNQYVQTYRTLAKNNRRFPAVIGYTIGNELNNEIDRANPQFWRALDDIAEAAKAADPNSLTVTALVDDGLISPREGNAIMDNLDAWGINIYRGRSFGQLFRNYDDISKKPLLITELGFPASTRNSSGSAVELPNNADKVADYLEDLWQEVLNNNATANPNKVASGIFLFEWTDEWWKNADTPIIQRNPGPGGQNGAYPGGWGDEEWFGTNSIRRGTPNVLDSRATFTRFKQLWN